MDQSSTRSVVADVPAFYYRNADSKCVPDYKDMIKRRLEGRIVDMGQTIRMCVGGRSFYVTISDIQGVQGPVEFDRKMFELQLNISRPCNLEREFRNDETDNVISAIRTALYDTAAYQRLGIPVAKTVLVHGPAGVGKSTIVRQANEELGCRLFEISVLDLWHLRDEFDRPNFVRYSPLRVLIAKAEQATPSLVVIRDLHILANRDNTTLKLADVIQKTLGEINSTNQVCIIGITRELHSLPESIRQTVFCQHISIPVPTLYHRTEILSNLLHNMNIQVRGNAQSLVTQLGLRTSGYVTRDLVCVCRNAVLRSQRRDEDIADSMSKLNLDEKNEEKSLVEWKDFEYAMSLNPLALQMEHSVLPTSVTWSDIGGYNEVKNKLKQCTSAPLLNPLAFDRLGINPPSGILLYGPSGCGKTALVKALVSDALMNAMTVRGPEIFSKYVGETEQNIRRLFTTAKRMAPCIVLIEELDAIGAKRGWGSSDSSGGVSERVLSALLNEMDGIEGRQGVLVIGCTGRPDQIDDAILRPGRLDNLVYVGLPNNEDRMAIMNIFLRKMPVDTALDVAKLAQETQDCTGADIEFIFREAGMMALREDRGTIQIAQHHVWKAAHRITAEAKQRIEHGELLKSYEAFHKLHNLNKAP